MDKKKEKFEVGDKVRVIDSEECYPYHYPMFKLMGFKDTVFNDPAPQGTVGTVFNSHLQEEIELFIGIDYGEGKQTLIGSEGVELVKEDSRLEEPIYRVGDTVYHYTFGKGTITEIDNPENTSFPIIVHFPKVGPKVTNNQYFRICGSENSLNLPTLSFTEYNLVDGGFSQERPLPYIELPNIHPKWKYFSKRGPIMSLWVDKPSKMWFTYSSDVERRHVGNILKVEIEDGIYKIKR